MNTRILTSVLTIVAVVAAVSAATYAFFNDTETSTNNVFAAGTLDLVLCDADEGDLPCEEGEESVLDGTDASFTASDLAPGGTMTQVGWIELRNTGSLPIAEVAFGATETGSDGDGDDLSNVLNLGVRTSTIDNTCTGSTDHTATIAAAIGDGLMPLTLQELEDSDYDSLPGIGLASSYFLCLDMAMQSTAGNEYQGDFVTDRFDFDAHQDASQ